MKDFAGKIAVVTGGASGIGFALCERAAAEGMKVVLADIEDQALADAAAKLEANGASTLSVRVDVSSFDDVQALDDNAVAAFGSVDLAFNKRRRRHLPHDAHLGEHHRHLEVDHRGQPLGRDSRHEGLHPPHAGAGERRAHGEHRLVGGLRLSRPPWACTRRRSTPWRRSRRRSSTSLGREARTSRSLSWRPEMVATGLRQSRRNMPSGFDEGVTDKDRRRARHRGAHLPDA